MVNKIIPKIKEALAQINEQLPAEDESNQYALLEAVFHLNETIRHLNNTSFVKADEDNTIDTKRRIGSTTRFIDDVIQKLFTQKNKVNITEYIIEKGYSRPLNEDRYLHRYLVRRIISRLKSEHNHIEFLYYNKLLRHISLQPDSTDHFLRRINIHRE